MKDRISVPWLFVLGFAFMVLSTLVNYAHAQTIPVTLSAAPSSSDGTVPVTLTWSATGATTCTASGAWSGSKAVSGTQTIQPPLAASQTYTLTCASPAAPGSATLDWSHATQNTNGTPMTPTGYRVNYGTSASSLPQVLDVAGTANTALVSNLTTGTWFFTVTTLAGTATSVPSNTVSKAVTAGPAGSGTASATHTVTAVPAPPTNVRVVSATAFEVRPNSTGTMVATRIGVVPIGVVCGAEQRTASGVTYNRVDPALVDLINFPAAIPPVDVFAKCG